MTSADMYVYVTTFCIAVVTLFVCWTLYYCIRILKRIQSLLDSVDQSLQCWSDGWRSIVVKFGTVRDTLQLLVRGMQTAQGVYSKYAKKKTSRGMKKNDEKES